MNCIIGIDVGTTATKGVLYDMDGKEIASLSQGYPLIQEKPGQAEEDPKLIFDAVQNIIFALAQKVQGKIIAISWSSQMHSLIAVDKNGKLLTNSITWADNRSLEIVRAAKKSGLAQKIYQKTGMPIHPMAPIYKIMWLKQEYPQLLHKVDKWIGIKEYLIYRLTGKIVTDTTMAAGIGLMNLKALNWDRDLLDYLDIAQEQLPALDRPSSVVGTVKAEYVQKLGLNPDTKIILGASDGYLSTIGVNVVDNNHFALNIGTSGAVRTFSAEAKLDQTASFFCYPAAQNRFLLGGPVNSGGIVFEWARKTLLGPNESPQDYLDIAQSAPAGSKGLVFLPYLGGERAPIWNSMARGSFVGLTREHNKAEMARAVLEGIIINLYDAASGLINNTKKPKAINATGGFLQSDFVRQLCANIFDVPLVTMKEQQSAAMAAMFLARQALGMSGPVSEISNFVQADKVYFPDEKEAAVYQDLIPLYREIAQDLTASYGKLAAFQKRYQ